MLLHRIYSSKPILACKKSSDTVIIFEIDDDGLSTDRIVGRRTGCFDDWVLPVSILVAETSSYEVLVGVNKSKEEDSALVSEIDLFMKT